MAVWSVEDRLETSLEDVHDVKIKVVGGDVAVTVAPGPATLDIQVLSGPPVDVVHEHEELRITYPEWPLSGLRNLVEGLSGRKTEVSVALTLPAHTRVDVTTVSAPVVVSGLAMPVHVNTVSGDVTLQGLSQGVDVKTVSGGVYAAGIDSELTAKTVSGAVAVAGSVCAMVDAKTVSGDVDLNLDLDRSGVYDITTVSGNVGMLLPAEPSLLVEATSVSGALDGDFDLVWEQKPGRRHIRQAIGEGQARLYVRTLSGRLRLRRRSEAA